MTALEVLENVYMLFEDPNKWVARNVVREGKEIIKASLISAVSVIFVPGTADEDDVLRDHCKNELRKTLVEYQQEYPNVSVTSVGEAYGLTAVRTILMATIQRLRKNNA